jgi:hypothetical protein
MQTTIKYMHTVYGHSLDNLKTLKVASDGKFDNVAGQQQIKKKGITKDNITMTKTTKQTHNKTTTRTRTKLRFQCT